VGLLLWLFHLEVMYGSPTVSINVFQLTKCRFRVRLLQTEIRAQPQRSSGRIHERETVCWAPLGPCWIRSFVCIMYRYHDVTPLQALQGALATVLSVVIVMYEEAYKARLGDPTPIQEMCCSHFFQPFARCPRAHCFGPDRAYAYCCVVESI
jgi:hypothetical protein